MATSEEKRDITVRWMPISYIEHARSVNNTCTIIFYKNQQVIVEYRKMPTQIFVSELNKYIREHKPPNMTVGMRWEDKRESNDSTIEPGKDWHAMFTAFNLYNYIHVHIMP